MRIGWKGNIFDTNWGAVYFVIFVIILASCFGFFGYLITSSVQGETSEGIVDFDNFILSKDYLPYLIQESIYNPCPQGC